GVYMRACGLKLIRNHAGARLIAGFLAAIAAPKRIRQLQGAIAVRPPAVLGIVQDREAAPWHHGLPKRLAFEDALDRRLKEAEPRRQRAGVGAVEFSQELAPSLVRFLAHLNEPHIAATQAFEQFVHRHVAFLAATDHALMTEARRLAPEADARAIIRPPANAA